MSHNFNWKNIPDTSKLKEHTESEMLSNKFFFDNSNSFDNKDNSITVKLTDINSLNLVINDNDCSDSFIDAICKKLDADGIVYKFTTKSQNLDVDNSVVITLDQQYVSGPKVSIIGQHNNNIKNNSDALALALDTAFRSKGSYSDGVFCGKRGFRKNDNNCVMTRIPTSTEDAVTNNKNVSFVTIAFGTDTPSPVEIANIIKEGLARYISYIDEYPFFDLIHRAEASDSIDSLANKFSCTPFELTNLNNIDITIPNDESIINPIGYNSRAFDKNINIYFLNNNN